MAPDVVETCLEGTITALGADGDGILHVGAATLFVPRALPGERVRVRQTGRQRAVLDSVLEPGPERAHPICTLFDSCGGCALQHMQPGAMVAFKRRLVTDALKGAGFVLPESIGFVSSPPRSRRRMDLALRRTTAGLLVGLHRRAGDVVDLVECHVLEPRLFALVEAMRPVLLRLTCLRRDGSAIVNLLDSGPDLLLATDTPPDSADRARLAEFARSEAVPRIAWRPSRGGDGTAETICAIAPVRHNLSGVEISPPPGAFLQATREGEAAIIAAVLHGLPSRLSRNTPIIELYAGCGTLSFALAAQGKVLAVEGQKEAFACLRAGAAGMRIEAMHRDLNRQPLRAAELSRAGAIVLDPPFAGAGPQMGEIARSGAACVITVSCNPRALARDSAMLREAGYRLERLNVIDQFLWSGGVESVAVFIKERK